MAHQIDDLIRRIKDLQEELEVEFNKKTNWNGCGDSIQKSVSREPR